MGGIEAAGAAGLTALLFYRSIAVSPILLLPVGGMFLYVWEKEILRKKEREFTRQFLDTLQSVSAALNVGYSLERNADHVSGTGSDSPGMEVYDPSDEDES